MRSVDLAGRGKKANNSVSMSGVELPLQVKSAILQSSSETLLLCNVGL